MEEWYQVFLCLKQEELLLGAEALHYLVDHLVEFLKRPGDTSRWILSLSERHCVAHGRAAPEGGAIMVWRNDQGEVIARIDLMHDERASWLETLLRYSES